MCILLCNWAFCLLVLQEQVWRLSTGFMIKDLQELCKSVQIKASGQVLSMNGGCSLCQVRGGRGEHSGRRVAERGLKHWRVDVINSSTEPFCVLWRKLQKEAESGSVSSGIRVFLHASPSGISACKDLQYVLSGEGVIKCKYIKCMRNRILAIKGDRVCAKRAHGETNTVCWSRSQQLCLLWECWMLF